MILGFGKTNFKTDDLVVIPIKTGKTPENFRAFLVDEGEIKDWEDTPKRLASSDGEVVFYVSTKTFNIEFAPQPDNAPQMGVKAQLEFIYENIHQQEYYRLASFLEGRDSNLSKDEVTLLAQDYFPSQMLMPEMIAEEWQKARTVFSNTLQVNMGLKCHALEPVFLENETSLQDLLSQPRNKVLLDDALVEDKFDIEKQTDSEAGINKEQREKLLLSIRLGTTFINVKDWWQGLQKLDEKLQERLQVRLDHSYWQVRGFYLKNDALSHEDRKQMKNMARRIDYYRRSTEALPRIEIQISSLKRSKAEQKEMFETMQLLLEKSRVFNTYIREKCINGKAINQETLQTLEMLEMQLAHAIKKRREY